MCEMIDQVLKKDRLVNRVSKSGSVAFQCQSESGTKQFQWIEQWNNNEIQYKTIPPNR